MDNSSSPINGLRNFLEKAESDGWISGYRWAQSDSLVLLREKLGGPRRPGISRTHKRGVDGIWYGLEVECDEGSCIGVDLEILVDRPILNRPDWISDRLGLGRVQGPRDIIEEWSKREAAFKSLSMQDQAKDRPERPILVSQFKRSGPNALSVYSQEGERSVQTRVHWTNKWVCSLAWCIL